MDNTTGPITWTARDEESLRALTERKAEFDRRYLQARMTTMNTTNLTPAQRQILQIAERYNAYPNSGAMHIRGQGTACHPRQTGEVQAGISTGLSDRRACPVLGDPMRPFEPTVPIYHRPEPGQPPRRIHRSIARRVCPSRRPPLFLYAALLVTICATLVILSN